MSDFHRAPPKMAKQRLCRITNESTETENCYSSLNREWLWNSVYVDVFFAFKLVRFQISTFQSCEFVSEFVDSFPT